MAQLERVPLAELTKALKIDRDLERKNLEAILKESEMAMEEIRERQSHLEKTLRDEIVTIFQWMIDHERSRMKIVSAQLETLDLADGNGEADGK